MGEKQGSGEQGGGFSCVEACGLGFFFWRWDIARIRMRGGREGEVRVWEDSDIHGEGRGVLGK